jgi:hypothetical protein
VGVRSNCMPAGAPPKSLALNPDWLAKFIKV